MDIHSYLTPSTKNMLPHFSYYIHKFLAQCCAQCQCFTYVTLTRQVLYFLLCVASNRFIVMMDC